MSNACASKTSRADASRQAQQRTKMNRLTSWINDAHAAAGASAFAFIAPQENIAAFDIDESSESVVDQAVQTAHQAFLQHRRSTLAVRAGWLQLMASVLEANAGRLAEIICEDV